MIPAFIFTALLCSIPSAHAGGKLSFVLGEVTFKAKGDFAKATMGQPLANGTTLKTGEKSLAIVILDSGSRLKMNSRSELTIEAGLKGDEGVTLMRAGYFLRSLNSKPKHFFIRTRAATMGVRGTRFFTAYGKVGADGQDVWMCVEDGEVAVEKTNDSKTVLVEKGQGVFVPAGKDVTPPKAYSWTKELNWNMDPATGEVEDHSSLESGYRDLTKRNYQ